MPKQITDQEIYIAPRIRGVKQNNQFIVTDEDTQKLFDITNIDDKILIYERQVKGWFLERANDLLNGNENDFLILMICISYFEGVQQYKEGRHSNRESKKFFVKSVQRLFPNIRDKDLEELYSDARCGLFHVGMIKKKTVLKNDFPNAFDFSDSQRIKINPKKLLDEINKDFDSYLRDLRDLKNTELRNSFNNLYTFN